MRASEYKRAPLASARDAYINTVCINLHYTTTTTSAQCLFTWRSSMEIQREREGERVGSLPDLAPLSRAFPRVYSSFFSFWKYARADEFAYIYSCRVIWIGRDRMALNFPTCFSLSPQTMNLCKSFQVIQRRSFARRLFSVASPFKWLRNYFISIF